MANELHTIRRDQVAKREVLGGLSATRKRCGCWRNIPISLIDRVLSVNLWLLKKNQSSNFSEFQRLRQTNIQ